VDCLAATWWICLGQPYLTFLPFSGFPGGVLLLPFAVEILTGCEIVLYYLSAFLNKVGLPVASPLSLLLLASFFNVYLSHIVMSLSHFLKLIVDVLCFKVGDAAFKVLNLVADDELKWGVSKPVKAYFCNSVWSLKPTCGVLDGIICFDRAAVFENSLLDAVGFALEVPSNLHFLVNSIVSLSWTGSGLPLADRGHTSLRFFKFAL
jgi:hypothetical protein